MANLRDRGGSLHIRVGGNSQETASMVDSLPNGLILHKDTDNTNNPVRRYHVGRCTQKVTQFFFKTIADQNATIGFHGRSDMDDG
jgi:hypothetical protein